MDENTPRAAASDDSLDAIAAISDPYDRAKQAWLAANRLLELRRLSETEAMCEHMDAWPFERSWVCSHIAALRWADGYREKAEQLLTKARSLVTGQGADWQQAEALVIAARRASEAGWQEPCRELVSEAVRLANQGQSAGNIQDSIDSGKVLREAAVLAAKLGFREMAERASSLVANEVLRQRAVDQIAEFTQRRKAG